MSEDDAPVVDMSLLRPDVIALLQELDELQTQSIQEFLQKNQDTSVDIGKIGMKLFHGNKQWISGEEILDPLTNDEMVFLAKILRYAMDETDTPNRPVPQDAKITPTLAGDVKAEWQTTPEISSEKVMLFIHGGGFTGGSPKSHRVLSIALGRSASMAVLSIDYRLAPEFPYPAALDDCVKAYKWLLAERVKPESIVIAGDSAGGTLTLATMLRLKDEGIPLPGAGVCLSPVTDLSLSDESFFTNARTDPMIGEGFVLWRINSYLGDADPKDEYISPLFANLEGLPPLLFQVSTIEMVYSDSARFVEKAKASGVDVTLQTWDDMIHYFQAYDFPESKDATEMIGEFIKKHVS